MVCTKALPTADFECKCQCNPASYQPFFSNFWNPFQFNFWGLNSGHPFGGYLSRPKRQVSSGPALQIPFEEQARRDEEKIHRDEELAGGAEIDKDEFIDKTHVPYEERLKTAKDFPLDFSEENHYGCGPLYCLQPYFGHPHRIIYKKRYLKRKVVLDEEQHRLYKGRFFINGHPYRRRRRHVLPAESDNAASDRNIDDCGLEGCNQKQPVVKELIPPPEPPFNLYSSYIGRKKRSPGFLALFNNPGKENDSNYYCTLLFGCFKKPPVEEEPEDEFIPYFGQYVAPCCRNKRSADFFKKFYNAVSDRNIDDNQKQPVVEEPPSEPQSKPYVVRKKRSAQFYQNFHAGSVSNSYDCGPRGCLVPGTGQFFGGHHTNFGSHYNQHYFNSHATNFGKRKKTICRILPSL